MYNYLNHVLVSLKYKDIFITLDELLTPHGLHETKVAMPNSWFYLHFTSWYSCILCSSDTATTPLDWDILQELHTKNCKLRSGQDYWTGETNDQIIYIITHWKLSSFKAIFISMSWLHFVYNIEGSMYKRGPCLPTAGVCVEKYTYHHL